METWWIDWFRKQQRRNFSDLAGANASLTIPVPDRLLAEVLRSRFATTVRELELRARPGNVVDVGVRLHKPAWLPRINAQLHVERQPQFPNSPVLILRLVSYGALSSFVGSAARFFGALPAGLRMEGDLLFVDIPVLARKYGAFDVLKYLTRLEVTTREGAIVVGIDGQIPESKESKNLRI